MCVLIAGSSLALTLLCVDVNGMFLLSGLGTQRLHLALRCYFLDTGCTHLIHDMMEEPGCVHRITKGGRRALELVIAAVIFSLMPVIVITLDMALGGL